jgi:hypothetical protein
VEIATGQPQQDCPFYSHRGGADALPLFSKLSMTSSPCSSRKRASLNEQPRCAATARHLIPPRRSPRALPHVDVVLRHILAHRRLVSQPSRPWTDLLVRPAPICNRTLESYGLGLWKLGLSL